MTRIAFLGLGAMGARMAAALIEGGHDVTVWNRSEGPAARLGAATAATPRAAAEGAAVVISMVWDDAASEAVWLDPSGGALAGMTDGAVGVEASTVSPGHVMRLHAAAAARGLRFIDAPLAGSRPQAEARQLIFMAGGEAGALRAVEPVLLEMGAAVHHAGGPGAGSTVKLMVNALFAAQLAMLGELIGMAARNGLDPARVVEIIGATPVASPAAKVAAAAMLAGNFAPAAPIELIAKDLALAAAMGGDLPLTEAAGAIYRAAVAEGYGADNVTGIVRRYGAPSPRAAAE